MKLKLTLLATLVALFFIATGAYAASKTLHNALQISAESATQPSSFVDAGLLIVLTTH